MEQKPVAQFIRLCSAQNLAEAQHTSSPWQGSSPAKTQAASRPFRAYGYHRRPSTNCYKLSDFCLPHASLRLALPQPEPTKDTGSASQWWPCTPAMAAGLTDRVWSLRKVLLFRVPPWPQPQELYAGAEQDGS